MTELLDLEAALSVSNTDVDEVLHAVADHSDAIFTWDYEKGARPQLETLYEKAKTSQWNGETDLPWDTDVDMEEQAMTQVNTFRSFTESYDLKGTPFEKWGDRDWMNLNIESANWTLSQFMHGEQGALICTAKIVETVPWIDAKYYAATQVMDEARHVEVFAKYLDTKLSGFYPVNAHLRMLLDDIVSDSRWDITYLGMQIMVEGLALAAFGFLHALTTEPLLKQLLRYVMSDEARHVAFGVLSLREYYAGLSDAEMFERQQFAYEASVRMRDRFLQQEVWDRMGVDVKQALQLVVQDPGRVMFQQVLFAKIVPNCKKLGLLDRNDGWLRRRFEELGVIQFEDWIDTSDEYEAMQLDPSLLAGLDRAERVTTPTKRRTDPEARRVLLLDAAIRAIRRDGADVSMTDIAAEAGVSKPVLYDSFDDKSGLAAALADRFLGELDTTLLDNVTTGVSAREALGRTIGVFVRFAEREPELYRFLVEGSAGTGREAVELPMLTHLADRISGYLTGPVATIDEPDRAESWAFAIMGMVFSAVGWWLDGQTRTRAQLVDDLTDLICGGLAGGGVDVA